MWTEGQQEVIFTGSSGKTHLSRNVNEGKGELLLGKVFQVEEMTSAKASR